MKDDLKKLSIIDEGFTIEGTLAGKGRLIVKGLVKGVIDGDDVVISEVGTVYAEAHARVMTIGGFFEGRAEIDSELVVLSTGKCSGQIKCRDLVVEAGGILNASVVCMSGSETHDAKIRRSKI